MAKPEKTRCGGTKTEAWYWGFIRSGLRRKFMCYPVNYQARNLARRKYEGPNERQRWEYQCSECRGWYMQKETQLDHVEPCGTLKCYEDLPGFVARLFCEANNLRVLCKSCHNKITHHS